MSEEGDPVGEGAGYWFEAIGLTQFKQIQLQFLAECDRRRLGITHLEAPQGLV